MKHQLPSIYFLHIPKTAGSSLASLIRCAYPEKLGIPAHQIAELLKLSAEEINKYKCFTGHFGTGLFSLLDHDIPCFTMLRDPFERVVSDILYGSKFPINLPEELSDELKQIYLKGDLREIFNHPFIPEILEKLKCIENTPTIFMSEMIGRLKSTVNTQNLYLGYYIDLNNYLDGSHSPLTQSNQTITNLEVIFVQQLMSGLDMDKIVSNAKQRLDKMEVVGIAEQFNDSAGLVCDFLGIRHPKTFPQENVSPEKLKLGSLTYRESGKIPDDVIKRIDELTACDREIYEYGKELFNQQLRTKKKFFWIF